MKIVRIGNPKGLSYEDIKRGKVFTWGSDQVLWLKTDCGMVRLSDGFTDNQFRPTNGLRIINGSFVEE